MTTVCWATQTDYPGLSERLGAAKQKTVLHVLQSCNPARMHIFTCPAGTLCAEGCLRMYRQTKWFQPLSSVLITQRELMSTPLRSAYSLVRCLGPELFFFFFFDQDLSPCNAAEVKLQTLPEDSVHLYLQKSMLRATHKLICTGLATCVCNRLLTVCQLLCCTGSLSVACGTTNAIMRLSPVQLIAAVYSKQHATAGLFCSLGRVRAKTSRCYS